MSQPALRQHTFQGGTPSDSVTFQEPQIIGSIDPVYLEQYGTMPTHTIPIRDVQGIAGLQYAHITDHSLDLAESQDVFSAGPNSLEAVLQRRRLGVRALINLVEPRMGQLPHTDDEDWDVLGRFINDDVEPSGWGNTNLFHDHMGYDVFIAARSLGTATLVGTAGYRDLEQMIGLRAGFFSEADRFANNGAGYNYVLNALHKNAYGLRFKDAVEAVGLSIEYPHKKDGDVIYMPGDRYTPHAEPPNLGDTTLRRSALVLGSPIQGLAEYKRLAACNNVYYENLAKEYPAQAAAEQN